MTSVPNVRVSAWRKAVFDKIAQDICSHWLARLQPFIALWHLREDVPVPKLDDVLVLPEMGTMTVRLPLGDGQTELLYSLSMFYGELRLGVVIPRPVLTRYPAVETEIATCYPEKKGVRVVKTAGGGVLFDWVFRDEWIARPEVMRESFHDAMIQEAIADAIAKSFQHLIMASLRLVLAPSPAA